MIPPYMAIPHSWCSRLGIHANRCLQPLAHSFGRWTRIEHCPIVPGIIRRVAEEEQVGYEVGDLQVWAALLEVRYQIVHTWIKHALAHGRPLPSANPEAWP